MKRMIKYLNKKQLILFVMSLIVILSSFSYAFYMYSETQTNSNLAKSACFKLTFQDKNDISLTDAVPLTEEEGNELVPYEFTIKNVCKTAANYQVNIETSNNSTLKTAYLRSKINDESSVILGEQEEVDTFINDDIKESRKVSFGTILENESITYKLRLWIDNDSTVEQSADKIWKGKVVVTGLMNKNPYSHKIRLHANGGYLSYNEIDRIPERIIGNIEEPIYDGYNFVGWYSDEELTHGISLEEEKAGNVNDLYAKYIAKTYKLSILPNQGEYKGSTSTYEENVQYGELYTLDNATRYGYTFAGWSDVSQINGTKFTMDDSDVTIRAQWEKNDYGYIVNHYQMTTDGSTYTLKESNTYEGKYEETKEGERKTYEGFTTPEAQTITIGVKNNKIDYYYERNKYELTIDCNGGSECPTPQEYYYEEEVKLPTINKVGYNFAGWDKTTTNNKYKMPASDTTISALWSAINYTITFNPNGGDALSTTEQTKSVTYDNTYGTLPSPTRIGYSFNGWYIDDTKIESTTVVKITENKIARANWNANTYNIEFEPNGGTLDTTSKEVVFDEEFGVLPVPVKKGYTFLGWFSDSALTQGITEQTVLQSEITKLYAKWIEGTYELTINPNGGSYLGSTGNKTAQVQYTQTHTLESVIPPTCKAFSNWEVVSGEDTSVSGNIVTMGKENSTVKALYTIKGGYTLTIDSDGGTGGSATVTNKNCGSTVTLSAPTKTGYTFNGWVKVDGEGSLTSNNVYTLGDGNATIKATWTANNYGYKVTHNQQNTAGSAYVIVSADTETGTKAYGTTYTPGVKTYTGFTSPSTQTMTITTEENNASPVNNVINYNYDRNKYTLTVKPNGGTYNSSTSDTTVSNLYYQSTTTIANPTRTGYDFAGWSQSPAGTMSGTTFTTPNSNATLTASWTAKTYTVTFNVNGGNALATSEQTKSVTYASTYGTLPTPTRSGYTFAGWYTASSGGTQKTSSTTVSITANETLYAQWTINTYAVNYNANGGSGAPAAQTKTYGTALTLSTTRPTRFGYNFKGWATSSSGSVAYNPGGSYTSNAGVTLYAVWQQDTITVGSSKTTDSLYAGQIYYYKFTPTSSGTYNFSSTLSSGDSYGYIYNSSGTQLTYNDDGGSGNNFLMSYSFTANTTYYLGVRWYSSSTTGSIPVSIVSNTPTLASAAQLGAYVNYPKPSGSTTLTGTYTGSSSSQTFNTSNYTGNWRVLSNDGTNVEIVTEGSIGNLYLYGYAGYRYSVYSLNQACGIFNNTSYADEARSIGCVSGMVSDIGAYNFSSFSGNPPYNETNSSADYQKLSNAGLIGSNYWMGSRWLYYDGTTYRECGGTVYAVNASGSFTAPLGTASWLGSNTMFWNSSSKNGWTFGVRAVVKLKSTVKISSGSGTSSSPYNLTI